MKFTERLRYDAAWILKVLDLAILAAVGLVMVGRFALAIWLEERKRNG